MQSYDFIDSVSKGYGFSWENRGTLARLAALPIALKIVILSSMLGFGLDDNFLRQGLFLIPADFFEGLFIVMAIRMAVFHDRFDLKMSMNPGVYRDALAGTILYVLIKTIGSLLGGLALSGGFDALQPAEAQDQSPLSFFAALFILVFAFWAFRLVFLYVPVAMGFGIKEILIRIRGYSFSFLLIATWMLCFIPVLLVLIFASEFITNIMGPAAETGLSFPRFAQIIVQSVAEILSSVLVSVSVAFGFAQMMDERG